MALQTGAAFSSYFGILAIISIATPWFLLLLPPVSLVYFLLQRYYIPAARELQRLESVTRSPIYSGFSEAVNGIATIRAFGRAAHFVKLEDDLISKNGMLFLTQRAGAFKCTEESCNLYTRTRWYEL
jgi:ATP-binding cassette, subfamily C (CFTR/MRP), member 1